MRKIGCDHAAPIAWQRRGDQNQLGGVTSLAVDGDPHGTHRLCEGRMWRDDDAADVAKRLGMVRRIERRHGSEMAELHPRLDLLRANEGRPDELERRPTGRNDRTKPAAKPMTASFSFLGDTGEKGCMA